MQDANENAVFNSASVSLATKVNGPIIDGVVFVFMPNYRTFHSAVNSGHAVSSKLAKQHAPSRGLIIISIPRR